GYRQACYLVKQPPAVSPREKPDQQWSGFFSSAGLSCHQVGVKKGSAARCLRHLSPHVVHGGHRRHVLFILTLYDDLHGCSS
ncbi:hypothetical protein, partial [Janthinobacterium sp. TND4EL3]|uniref:hypothetical protein n=1 Tax=Janthinobacterium sp. TND4EL3 TaxID=1907311 RepID=UPI001BAF3878